MSAIEKETGMFAWYGSYTDAVDQLPTIKDKYQMMDAIVQYGSSGKEPRFQDTPTCPAFALQAIFEACRVNIDNSRKSYKNGCKGAEHGKKGGRPRKGETKEQAYARRQEEAQKAEAALDAAQAIREQELIDGIVY